MEFYKILLIFMNYFCKNFNSICHIKKIMIITFQKFFNFIIMIFLIIKVLNEKLFYKEKL